MKLLLEIDIALMVPSQMSDLMCLFAAHVMRQRGEVVELLLFVVEDMIVSELCFLCLVF